MFFRTENGGRNVSLDSLGNQSIMKLVCNRSINGEGLLLCIESC